MRKASQADADRLNQPPPHLDTIQTLINDQGTWYELDAHEVPLEGLQECLEKLVADFHLTRYASRFRIFTEPRTNRGVFARAALPPD